MSLNLSKSCRPNLVLFLCLITAACGTVSQQNTNLGGSNSSTKLNFAPRVDFNTGGTMDTGGFHSGSLAVGDFNGDGFPDIAVSNEMSNTISVFLNDGKGHFSNPIITPVQISALNVGPIAAGDLNGMAATYHPDAVLVNSTMTASIKQTLVRWGEGLAKAKREGTRSTVRP